jgi:hypothetical protein
MTTFGTILSTDNVKPQTSLTPTDASTINLTVIAGKNTVVSWTSTQNSTVNISVGVPQSGDELTILIANDATLSRVITFGTLLTSVGIVTGVISKTTAIKFVGDGTKFIEVSRTVEI